MQHFLLLAFAHTNGLYNRLILFSAALRPGVVTSHTSVVIDMHSKGTACV